MLHVHRADRADALVGALAEVLATPADGGDPFAPEVVAVPSRGIERWLAQELSTRLGASTDAADGVCANVVFPFPATVVRWAVDAAPDRPVDLRGASTPDDPWAPQRLTWTLLSLLEEGVVPASALGAFGAHLAGEAGRDRRLPALRHVADLFDRYAVHRPAMVRAWARGEDVDAHGDALPETARWQAALWRAARAALDTPSFGERVGALDLGLAGVPGLPSRLCLHGLTALPASYVEVLDALAIAHDVHLFLLHPSPGSWDALAPVASALTDRPLRSADPTRHAPRHPLVASWGRDSRELQLVLAGRGTAHDLAPAGPATPTTLLARLQADVRQDLAPPGRPLRGGDPDGRFAMRADDRSVQVHACHGRLRQVEVLRDAILGILSDDPTIQPRDVVVMCPDVEAFAPLVDAVFGADARVDHDAVGDRHGGLPDIRVRLADRSLRQVNPLLRTLADVLDLPEGRLEGTTLVDLARRGPVRRRFGWGDDDLATIEGWVADLGIRWGLDADHRREHGLPTDEASWRRGLDRLLVGVAVAEDGPRLVGGVLPHDDVEGTTVDLAGRLAEFVDRIGTVRRLLADPRPVDRWVADLTHAVELLAATEPDELWQRRQFDGVLEEVVRSSLLDGADGATCPVPISLGEIGALLDDSLRGRPSRANHRTGDLTVCTLVPMRSVPYRVVCLLGLDDETFPRRTTPSGDDLVAARPVVGDRDPRTEDRQLLLDALLAAGDHVVITHQGRDVRSDAPVPPAVPVAELLDVLDATARPAEPGLRVRDVVVRQHPLRAADPRTFDPTAPFGFDPVARDAAAAIADAAPPRFLDALPAPMPMATTVEWADFVRFLQDPVKGWLGNRLGVRLRGGDDVLDDLLPVDLGGLDQWQVGTRLLAAALGGDDRDVALAAERARGALPVGRIGDAAVAGVVETIDKIVAVVQDGWGDRLAGRREPVDVDLRIGELHLVGVVDGALPDLLARLEFGKPKPKRLLGIWLPWLALHAQGDGREALMVSRGKTSYEGTRLTHLPADLAPDVARDRLEALVDLYVSGHDQPLVAFEASTGVFAAERRGKGGRDGALKRVRKDWVTTPFGQARAPWGDGTDPSVVQVFGRVDFDEVLAMEPLPHEAGDGWAMDEPSRFGRIARRLWDPILDQVASKAWKW